jgi:orotidine-5'-phosphate decarboxylase
VKFTEKLAVATANHHSLLCVGLDPDVARFPAEFKDKPDAIFLFCKAIIDATAIYACAFKPQIAYFAALAAEDQLQAICDYLKQNYPNIPIVLDAKRGDIGSTAEQYAREAFERYNAEAGRAQVMAAGERASELVVAAHLDADDVFILVAHDLLTRYRLALDFNRNLILGRDVDIAGMARAQGALGIGPVEKPADLLPALKQGIAAVQAGQVCVIDARVLPGYDDRG